MNEDDSIYKHIGLLVFTHSVSAGDDELTPAKLDELTKAGHLVAPNMLLVNQQGLDDIVSRPHPRLEAAKRLAAIKCGDVGRLGTVEIFTDAFFDPTHKFARRRWEILAPSESSH